MHAGAELPGAEQLCQEVERALKARQAEAEDSSLAAAGAPTGHAQVIRSRALSNRLLPHCDAADACCQTITRSSTDIHRAPCQSPSPCAAPETLNSWMARLSLSPAAFAPWTCKQGYLAGRCKTLLVWHARTPMLARAAASVQVLSDAWPDSAMAPVHLQRCDLAGPRVNGRLIWSQEMQTSTGQAMHELALSPHPLNGQVLSGSWLA